MAMGRSILENTRWPLPQTPQLREPSSPIDYRQNKAGAILRLPIYECWPWRVEPSPKLYLDHGRALTLLYDHVRATRHAGTSTERDIGFTGHSSRPSFAHIARIGYCHTTRASLAQMRFGNTPKIGKEAHGCGILPNHGFSGR